MQAREGAIEEGSPAWEALSVGDRGKRKRAAEEKNLKLRSPNFSVSQTRLSLRNIPQSLDEKGIKQLFIAAVSSSGHLIWCRVPCLGAGCLLLAVVVHVQHESAHWLRYLTLAARWSSSEYQRRTPTRACCA